MCRHARAWANGDASGVDYVDAVQGYFAGRLDELNNCVEIHYSGKDSPARLSRWIWRFCGSELARDLCACWHDDTNNREQARSHKAVAPSERITNGMIRSDRYLRSGI